MPRDRLAPEAMFPAGDARFRTAYLSLKSGWRVRAVECGPADGPAVLLLPGWGAPAYLFRGILPPLCAAGYRAIVVEPIGYGLSDKPTERAVYATERMIVHVREIIDALGPGSFILGGHSLGAAMAARAAETMPDRIRALVLISPIGTHGVPWLRFFRLITTRKLRRLLPRLVTRSLIWLLLVIGYGRFRAPPPRDVDEYWAPSQFPEFTWAMSDLLHDLDWGEATPFSFGRVRVPTLVVHGVRDHLVRRTRVIEEARKWAHVRVVPIEAAGHIITDDAPDLVTRAILDFLSAN